MRAKILRIMENAKVDERTAIGALQERSNTKVSDKIHNLHKSSATK